MKKFFLLSLLATTTIETWTMKNTRNHETMTVKKIGRRGAPKTFLLCALDTEKKEKGFFYCKPECRIWFNVAEKWRLSSACTTHYSHCLLQCECFFPFFKPKTDVEKNWKPEIFKFAFFSFLFCRLSYVKFRLVLTTWKSSDGGFGVKDWGHDKKVSNFMKVSWEPLVEVYI